MPLGESMISSVKSNKSIMLDKSKRFRKTLGGYGKNQKLEYDLPKATPKQLRAIRNKLKKRKSNPLGKNYRKYNYNNYRFGLDAICIIIKKAITYTSRYSFSLKRAIDKIIL